MRRLGLPPQLIFPLGYVLKLVEKKDAFSLTLSDWLHNPNISSSFELLHEQRVIAGKVVRGGEKIELGGLVVLAFPLQLFLVPLQVLYHQVLTSKLIVVSVMVDSLMRLQMSVVKNVVYLISFNPKNVPVVTLCLFVSSLSEGLKHAVPERCLEFDLTEVVDVVVLLNVFSKIFRHLFLTISNNFEFYLLTMNIQ